MSDKCSTSTYARMNEQQHLRKCSNQHTFGVNERHTRKCKCSTSTHHAFLNLNLNSNLKPQSLDSNAFSKEPHQHFHTLKSTLNSSAQWFWSRLLWTANKQRNWQKKEKKSLTAIFSSLRWTSHYTWEKKKEKIKKNSQQRNKLAQESSTLTLQTNEKEKSVNKKLTSKWKFKKASEKVYYYYYYYAQFQKD